MTPIRSVPVLPVGDLDAALGWYARLGFAVEWRRGEESAAVSSGPAMLILASRGPGSTLGPAEVVVTVTDADAVAAFCAEAGLRVAEPIATKPWGARELTVSDPFGNALIFGHDGAADGSVDGG